MDRGSVIGTTLGMEYNTKFSLCFNTKHGISRCLLSRYVLCAKKGSLPVAVVNSSPFARLERHHHNELLLYSKL